MRIKSYLAVLVLTGLLGGYILEQVLTYHFDHVDNLKVAQTKNLLWQKDVERIENSASQFLISTDLVVASANTYLIFGAKHMGTYLTTELSKIESSNPYPELKPEIKRSIANVKTINNYLDEIGNMSADKLHSSLINILNKYDPVSLELSNDIQMIGQVSSQRIESNATYVEQEIQFMNLVGWIVRVIFLLLIIALWWWSDRKICLPLNSLINSANKALAGSDFKATDNAPLEIIELSNDFKLLTETLSHQASHDPLTELYNRRIFERNLHNIISDDDVYFLCFIDLDYFKTINDTCGHAAGDEILVSVARILNQNVRVYDTVARLGGDEFAILIKNCDVKKVLSITNAIRKEIYGLSYQWKGEKFQLSASIGVAEKITDSTTKNLLNSADVACSLAKESGRNSVCLFDENSKNKVGQQQNLLSVHQINNALSNELFVLYKQDITPLQDKENGKYFEVLLRMIDGEKNIVSPASFLPVAERYQLSSKIDRWVVNSVYEFFDEHSDQIESINTISINLSGHSMTDNELEAFIIDKLQTNIIPPHKICFEITETAAITNTERAQLFINNLKDLGCRFALDDFGTGHASYSYIKEFPTDTIKIDGSFVTNMLESKMDYAAIKSMCEIAKAANQKIVAEYVEDVKVVEALTELGVDYAQGYYFSKPEALTNILN